MKFILGEKVEMSQHFAEDGKVTPVTIIKAGPCQVTQVKQKEKDGYRAVQIGFGQKKKLKKSLLGHLKDLPKFRYLREFKLDDNQEIQRGQEIKVQVFKVGEKVKVTGVSKGKGFQGVVKRHGFHGSPASHGHKDQLRMPGSIGATNPAHVFKGTRMAGRMGQDQVTLSNLEVIQVSPEDNLLYLKGAVPGPRHGLILIQAPGELEVQEPVKEVAIKEEVQSESVPETVKLEESRVEDSKKEEKKSVEIKKEDENNKKEDIV